MKKLLITPLLFFSIAAQAADFSYNNVSISYANVDLEIFSGISIDGDGFDVEANFAITDTIFIPVRYQSIGYDFGIDTTMYMFGIGAHMPVSGTTDLYGAVQFGNFELDFPPAVDEDSLALTVGIRTKIGGNIEADLYATTISYDTNFNDQSGIGAKLNIPMSKTMAIVARFEILSDIDTMSIGARFDF